ncbi:hypothetical protein T10_389 [Trichinella papuae]|uniref:Uncharacterized protein n=1 Tax=Trichinella papuae TaxID=268474 RepID=A0A0V1M7Z1_9BILA|nr:hypothetical protein T10_389 [Trichinella papuae]
MQIRNGCCTIKSGEVCKAKILILRDKVIIKKHVEFCERYGVKMNLSSSCSAIFSLLAYFGPETKHHNLTIH